MSVEELWPEIRFKIPADGPLRTLIDITHPFAIDGRKVWLDYSRENTKQVETLATESNRSQLQTLLREESGRDWSIEICSA